MRKDVRTGLAVGSFLFIGILVYVLFFTGGAPKDPNRSQANNSTATGSGSGGASSANSGSTPAERVVTPVVTHVTPTETPRPRQPDPVARPVPSDNAAVSALTANPTTRPITTATADAPATDPRTIASGNSFDWKAALNNGVTRALLGQATVTPDAARPAPDRAPEPPVAANAARRDIPIIVDPPDVPPATASREYVLKQGDTFWTIAKAEYGNASYFSHIVRANPQVNPSKIKAGTTIILPAKEQVVPANVAAASNSAANAATPTTRPSATAAAIDSATEYRVQSGENLYLISKKLYGRGDRSAKLYEFNKELIGPNPNALKKGTLLKLPEPPTTNTLAGAPN